MKNSEIFLKAADVIEERGWHRFGFAPEVYGEDLETCAVCVLGAINVAAGNPPDGEFHRGGPASDAALAFAGYVVTDPPRGGVDRYDVVDHVGDYWNDQVCPDAEFVVLALRVAAQAEAEAGR